MPDQPRNVRLLEHQLNTRHYRLYRGSWPVLARIREGPTARMLTMSALFPLAPHRDYTISRKVTVTSFRTTDQVDRVAPRGGELLAAFWHGRGGGATTITLVHSAVSDESPLYPVIESWIASDPVRVTMDFGHRVAEWTAAPGTRHLGEVEPRAVERLQDLPGVDRLVLVYQARGEEPCLGGTPERFAVASKDPDETLIFRTRWVDAAGNETPWSYTLRIPARSQDGEVWAKEAELMNRPTPSWARESAR